MSVLLITHDLGVVAETCHRVVVMQAGRVVEIAPVDALFAEPVHPYTRRLLGSILRPDLRPTPSRAPAGERRATVRVRGGRHRAIEAVSVDAWQRTSVGRPELRRGRARAPGAGARRGRTGRRQWHERDRPLIEVDNLQQMFTTRGRSRLRGQRRQLRRRARARPSGWSGESGSGKSTVARCLVRLQRAERRSHPLSRSGRHPPQRRRVPPAARPSCRWSSRTRRCRSTRG